MRAYRRLRAAEPLNVRCNNRTKLSKALITDPAKIEWRSSAELKAKYGVGLRTGVEVTAVSPGEKEVIIGSGQRVPYDTLVLATGGVPRRLPIDGADLANVFTLRGVDDTKKIDAGGWLRLRNQK